jgi:hypothetical protein
MFMPKITKTTKTKKTKTYTGKPKSIGPKFCAVLLIFILAIFALISNLILLKTVRDEAKITFDNELNTAVEVLVNNINTVHSFDSSDTAKTLALKMVENATWNNGTRHFWAATPDYKEFLAGTKDFDEFYQGAHRETKFGFIVMSGYDKAYFTANARPITEEYIRISTAATLIIAIFALGACVIAFHRSATCRH